MIVLAGVLEDAGMCHTRYGRASIVIVIVSNAFSFILSRRITEKVQQVMPFYKDSVAHEENQKQQLEKEV